MALLLACESAAPVTELIQGELAESVNDRHNKREADEAFEQRELVARALRGEQRAFDDIFDRYGGLMLRTAYSIVKDRDSAEDIVQNSLLLAWQHLPNLRETGALRPWLMRIVVNQCISLKRRHARATMFLLQSFSEQEMVRASQIADDAKGHMERNWDLAQAIAQLPAKQKMIITLHYYYGMTLPEISQKLQISQNTLKKRVQVAISHLRRTLRTVEVDEDVPLPGPRLPGGW